MEKKNLVCSQRYRKRATEHVMWPLLGQFFEWEDTKGWCPEVHANRKGTFGRRGPSHSQLTERRLGQEDRAAGRSDERNEPPLGPFP